MGVRESERQNRQIRIKDVKEHKKVLKGREERLRDWQDFGMVIDPNAIRQRSSHKSRLIGIIKPDYFTFEGSIFFPTN